MTPVIQWLELETVLAVHEETLSIDGGVTGLRDQGLLESALKRSENRHHYEGVDDLCELAATYCVGIARNRPFADGAKRSAFIAIGAFLAINGRQLMATQEDAAVTMLGVAAGDIGIEELAGWIRANSAAA